MQTSIYRLTPRNPRIRDSGAAIGEVDVRAGSPTDARFVAAEAQQAYVDEEDGVEPPASCFLDERLYAVVQPTRTAHAHEGPRTVLRGDITSRVMQARRA
jgi:hypothetical protein